MAEPAGCRTGSSGMAQEKSDAQDVRSTARSWRRRVLGLRARIIAPLLLPILGLLALSGILLSEQLTTVAAMQRVMGLTALVTDTSALVHEVQRERGASSGFLSSKGNELGQELTAQRRSRLFA